MTLHDRRIASEAPSKHVRVRPFGGAEMLRLARGLVVFTPHGNQIAPLMEKARKTIPMLTSADVVERVASHNPDCFWGVARRNSFDIKSPEPQGYFALLPLTKEGLGGLLSGALDRKNPPLCAIAAQNEKPAAIYIWHVYAPGALAAALPLACSKILGAQDNEVDVYGWATNPSAVRYLDAMGFRRMPNPVGALIPQFHVFRRGTPPFGISSPPPARLSVRVARSFDDLARAVAIRGAVYIGEQECPYEEEFDGNDFSATHLIGYVGDEPAGCMRIRYFADFAKVERLVVRKEFRSSGLARQIVHDSVALCEAKGYQRVYVYAQKRLVKFWSKCGFAVPASARELVFSDFDYVEMLHASPRKHDAISEQTNPYVIIRPEGDWGRAGILERSVSRGLRQPSVGVA